MRAVPFPEANISLAENQDEYETLPIYMDVDENKNPAYRRQRKDEGDGTELVLCDPMGQAICCFELNKEEIDEIVRTGKIWHTQCTFWGAFQPINMSTQNPFNQ